MGAGSGVGVSRGEVGAGAADVLELSSKKDQMSPRIPGSGLAAATAASATTTPSFMLTQ